MGNRVLPPISRKFPVYFGFAVATAIAASLGSRYNPGRPETRRWYDALEKPAFTPPDRVFAPVWTALYAMIAVSGARLFLARPPARDQASRRTALALWGTQLALNAAWSPLFFGRKDPRASLLDIGGMIVSIGTFSHFARRVDRSAAILFLPYLAWTLFAGALNEEIWRKNRMASSTGSGTRVETRIHGSVGRLGA